MCLCWMRSIFSLRGTKSLACTIFSLALSPSLCAQTPSTGAVTGALRGPSNTALPGASVELIKGHAVFKSAISDESGRFGFLLLLPGEYAVRVSESGFQRETIQNIHVFVTETVRLELTLQIAAQADTVEVVSSTQMVQPNSLTLGRAVGETTVRTLPLVTRNFSQIAALSPGVASGVYNAAELGTGATALSQIGKSFDGIFAHGARSYDNSWQLDGINVSDGISAGPLSGGIPVPNPDGIQEFKVQTGLYDAGFGKGAGANVSLVSKAGGSEYHGTAFEYLRNNALDANDYFIKRAGQERPALRQNQFGFAAGGPIHKNKVHFFGSYQGTRQTNGLAMGQGRIACSASLSEPPLTDDRSPAALGGLFEGMTGQLGGVAVRPDGSNINPAALALLNYKLPDGRFLVPTPQTIDSSKPLGSQGFSVFSNPCTFSEDQFLGNLDFNASKRNQFAVRTFGSRSDQNVSFVGNGLNPDGNTPGFTSAGSSDHLVVSLAHTFIFKSNMLNEAHAGIVTSSTGSGASSPFKWSDISVSESDMNHNNELPSLAIAGSVAMTSSLPRTYDQHSFAFNDNLILLRGGHELRVGGSFTRPNYDTHFTGAVTSLRFLSWPDFLLGLDGASNGTGSFSNVFSSGDVFGLLDRHFRVWEGSAFIQDEYRIRPTLALNIGMRFERLGQFDDALGRNSSFDFNKADKNPSPEGSLDGYIVGSNFTGDTPPGVTKVSNNFGTYAEGQNAFGPRVGVSWQLLPKSTRMVLRSGYGIYYSRPPAQTAIFAVLGAPFGLTRISTGAPNAAATFQNPFAQPFPTASTFPLFVPYSPNTHIGINTRAPNFRPAIMQEFGINIQSQFSRNWLLEIGYVGSRGTHLQRFRSLNQALNASAERPVHGETTNTLANVSHRVPILGIRPDSLRALESEGNSWYNGLEASLTKRFSRGFQLLASYTFSKTLDTDGADVNSTSVGNALTLGDQNSPRRRWGRTSFDRTHRFVLSGLWNLPTPKRIPLPLLFGNWSSSVVVTIQSGTALTIGYTNSTNVFGITGDRAQLSGKCTNHGVVNGGSTQSNLNHYFSSSCFTTPTVIGDDGTGTGFGNSGTGIANGPGQANLDLALEKSIRLAKPADARNLALRAEFFNAFNHPQFANPDTTFGVSTFGVISGTSVNARVMQLALRLSF